MSRCRGAPLSVSPRDAFPTCPGAWHLDLALRDGLGRLGALRASGVDAGFLDVRCVGPSWPVSVLGGPAPPWLFGGLDRLDRLPRRSPRRTRPTCSRLLRRRGTGPVAGRSAPLSPPRDGRRTSGEPRWSSTTDTSSCSAPSRSIVRTKLCPVQPKSQELRTIQPSRTSCSPSSFVRPYTDSGAGSSDSTYGSGFRPSKT